VEPRGPPRKATRSESRPPVAHAAAAPETPPEHGADEAAEAPSDTREAALLAAIAPTPRRGGRPATRQEVRPEPPGFLDAEVALGRFTAERAQVSFDGGCVRDLAAFAVYVSDAAFFARRIDGATSQEAEVSGARAAIDIATALVERGARHVTIKGDSHNTVSTILSGMESVFSRPDRSPLHSSWRAVALARARLDETIRRAGAEVVFRWEPRANNKKADHLCDCALLSAAPAPSTITEGTAPVLGGKPAQEQLEAIMRDLAGGGCRSLRSLPPAFATTWRAVVDIVAGWGCPLALWLAPAVLLKKRGPPLRARLLQFCSLPGLVAQWFAAAAADGLRGKPRDEESAGADNRERDPHVLEKLAAVAPGRALKMLNAAPPLDATSPENRDAIINKLGAIPLTTAGAEEREREFLQQHPATERRVEEAPPPATEEMIIRTAARDMAKAAAPGPDGLTREIFLASCSAKSRPLWALLVCRWAAGVAESAAEAVLLKASRVVAWKKPSGGARVIGMANFSLKLAWRVALSAFLSRNALPKWNCAFAPAGALNAVAAVAALLREGRAVFIGDVADAFYSTNRALVHERVANTPLAGITSLVLGAPAVLVGLGAPAAVDKGMLPGCGGAAVLFALAAATPSEKIVFADDFATDARRAASAIQEYESLGFVVAKRRVIIPPGCRDEAEARAIAKRLGAETATAGKYLGAAVGEVRGAAAILQEDVARRKAQLEEILAAPLSLQGRWAMAGAALKGLLWALAAASPAAAAFIDATAPTSAAILADDALRAAVLAFAGATPEAETPDTRRLLYAPLRVTGLGLPLFGVEQPRLHASFFAFASWPPRAPDRAAEKEFRQALAKEKAADFEKTAPAGSAVASGGVLTKNFCRAHADDHDWLSIRRVRRHLCIDDVSWRRAFAERIFVASPFVSASCPASGFETAGDHYHGCSRCAAWFWAVRHAAVASAFRAACAEYGVVCSAALRAVFGAGGGEADAEDKKDQPDLAVFCGGGAAGEEGEKVMAIDFSIAHHAATAVQDHVRWRAAEKRWKYRDWRAGAVIAPVVFSTRHTVESQSAKILAEIGLSAARPGFARDALSRVKVALLRVAGARARLDRQRAQQQHQHQQDEGHNDGSGATEGSQRSGGNTQEDSHTRGGAATGGAVNSGGATTRGGSGATNGSTRNGDNTRQESHTRGAAATRGARNSGRGGSATEGSPRGGGNTQNQKSGGAANSGDAENSGLTLTRGGAVNSGGAANSGGAENSGLTLTRGGAANSGGANSGLTLTRGGAATHSGGAANSGGEQRTAAVRRTAAVNSEQRRCGEQRRCREQRLNPNPRRCGEQRRCSEQRRAANSGAANSVQRRCGEQRRCVDARRRQQPKREELG
jgi:hypothetical protein